MSNRFAHWFRVATAEYLRRLRAYFIAGLLVLIPLGLTALVVHWLYTRLNTPASWIANKTQLNENIAAYLREHENLHGFLRFFNYESGIPGLGVLLTLLIIVAAGMVAKNYFGRKAIGILERLVYRIPLIRRIYDAIKQISTAVFEHNTSVFKAVVLVEFPRKGIWSLGFITQTEGAHLSRKLPEDVVWVFVSTTPNPTSGFLIVSPLRDLILLDVSVEDGMKLIISAGLVIPPGVKEVTAEEHPGIPTPPRETPEPAAPVRE